MYFRNAFSVKFREHVLISSNKRLLSALSSIKKPSITITQNLNKSTTMHTSVYVLMRYNFFRQSLPRLSPKIYISRNINGFNNRTQLSERSPQNPLYPNQRYVRFKNATPFYQKQIFWV